MIIDLAGRHALYGTVGGKRCKWQTVVKLFGAICLTLLSLATFGQRDVTGYYSSNVADLGFFVERIHLKSDLTFRYEFSGDLQYRKGQGTYKVIGRTIYLKFDPLAIDTTNIYQILHGLDTVYPSEKFLFKGGKLWGFHVHGYVVKRGQAISRHKRYLFFGDRYLTKRRMYLQKRKGKELLWIGEESAIR